MVEEKLYKNKHWLKEQVRRGLSLRNIAELAGCSHTTVNRWVKKLEIKLNGRAREVELRNLLLSMDEKITGRDIREQFKRVFTVKRKKKKTGLDFKIDYTTERELEEIIFLLEGHY